MVSAVRSLTEEFQQSAMLLSAIEVELGWTRPFDAALDFTEFSRIEDFSIPPLQACQASRPARLITTSFMVGMFAFVARFTVEMWSLLLWPVSMRAKSLRATCPTCVAETLSGSVFRWALLVIQHEVWAFPITRDLPISCKRLPRGMAAYSECPDFGSQKLL